MQLCVLQNYGGKMVFDTSVRRQFEDSLVAEVADAVSLPVKNVSIEEVSEHLCF